MIVLDDASLEAAVEGISTAGYFNGGQDCTAATRVIAQGGVYDDFVAALSETARNTKTGAPDDEDVAGAARSTTPTSSRTSPVWSSGHPHAEVTAGGHPDGLPRLLLRADGCRKASSRRTS